MSPLNSSGDSRSLGRVTETAPEFRVNCTAIIGQPQAGGEDAVTFLAPMLNRGQERHGGKSLADCGESALRFWVQRRLSMGCLCPIESP